MLIVYGNTINCKLLRFSSPKNTVGVHCWLAREDVTPKQNLHSLSSRQTETLAMIIELTLTVACVRWLTSSRKQCKLRLC